MSDSLEIYAFMIHLEFQNFLCAQVMHKVFLTKLDPM